MAEYFLTADSTCDLPFDLMEKEQIFCIGMKVRIVEEEFIDGPGSSVTRHEFYERLRAGEVASTTQVNMYDFIDFVEPLLQQGKDVLHVCFSSGLSGTVESCRRGAEELMKKYPDRRVAVVDSLSASVGEGLLVWCLNENRKAGMSLDDNVAWAEKNRLHMIHWFTVDDLMFLHRGGRVSKTSAVFGSLLGIKPVLNVDDEGHLILKDKVRGRQAALTALVDHMLETMSDGIAPQTVFIGHGDCEEDAKTVAKMVKERTGLPTKVINHIGCVVGCHSGPGTVALFFLGTKR